ncbi:GroES-like protein [Trametes polyzona]|nr:GroES-like protein [Trametes polyzona]
MQALIVQTDKEARVQDHPIPSLGDNDVLVRNIAVALSPADLFGVGNPRAVPGAMIGCDWAGEIVQVGKSVSTRKVGERVAGMVHGGWSPRTGAFAEYVQSPADLVWSMPEGVSFAEAATVSIGAYTCAQALYHKGRLELPLPQDPVVERDEWVFVYGGSSSCGQYAIQLVRASGFKVVTTSSPHNFDMLRSLGATAVFDYRGPSVVEKIKAVTGDTIRYGLDAIGQPATQDLSQRVFGPAGGKLITLLWANETKVREDVDLSFTLVHTGLGEAFDIYGIHFPLSPEDTAQMAEFVATVSRLIEQGRLKANPVKLWEGRGLAAIPDALKYIGEGKVSAQKIVVLL